MTVQLLKAIERRKRERALLKQLSVSNETLSVNLPAHYNPKKHKPNRQLSLGRRYTNKITKALRMADLIEREHDPLRHLGFKAKKHK